MPSKLVGMAGLIGKMGSNWLTPSADLAESGKNTTRYNIFSFGTQPPAGDNLNQRLSILPYCQNANKNQTASVFVNSRVGEQNAALSRRDSQTPNAHHSS
jgi:hypothetical protein